MSYATVVFVYASTKTFVRKKVLNEKVNAFNLITKKLQYFLCMVSREISRSILRIENDSSVIRVDM